MLDEASFGGTSISWGFYQRNTGFYRVLPGFIKLDLDLPSFTGLYWVLLGFAGFYLVFSSFHWVWVSYTGFSLSSQVDEDGHSSSHFPSIALI